MCSCPSDLLVGINFYLFFLIAHFCVVVNLKKKPKCTRFRQFFPLSICTRINERENRQQTLLSFN